MLNASRNKKENLTQIWQIQGEDRKKVELAQAGDIVGVVGLRESYTGDTLTDTRRPVVLEKITFPQTVISMSIEPESSAIKTSSYKS